jgi:hypothetical protein
MAAYNISPLMLKEWGTKQTKSLTADSVWGQLSNLAERARSMPNASEFKIPGSVLHYVRDTMRDGVFSTTIPMVMPLVGSGKGGKQKAEGFGERPEAKSATVFWNTIRKPTDISTKGVENVATRYLRVAQNGSARIKEWFDGILDLCNQQALCDGGSEFLTDSKYWVDYGETTTAPVTKKLHPNLTWTGATSALARGADYAADIANLITALGNLTAANTFGLAALDGAIHYAHRHVTPLRWASQGGTVNYIILISPMQAQDLSKDQEWVSLVQGADRRGPDNRALTGIIGRRGDALVIEDQRSPIFHLSDAETGSTGFEYCDNRAANAIDAFYGVGNLARVAKGSGAVGTCEVARLLGKGAVGVPMVSDLTYNIETKDFDMQRELCGEMNIGHQRMDFAGKDPVTKAATVYNASSGLYFTSTPAVAY